MIDVVLDLSHHNSLTPSAFHDMKDAGIRAIIHKSSQAASSKDPEYAKRRPRAAAVGILWGAYHFGTLKADPVKQAEHFVATVGEKDAEDPAVLLCLDWEGNAKDTMNRKGAEAFVSHVKKLTGKFPVLYSGHAFINAQMDRVNPNETVLSNCKLWLARYGPKPPQAPRAWSSWDLWQYSSAGNVDGIKGNVDRNLFKGDLDQLKAWWRW